MRSFSVEFETSRSVVWEWKSRAECESKVDCESRSSAEGSSTSPDINADACYHHEGQV